jgi:poly(3-hydroxybutyrate) depolymerase
VVNRLPAQPVEVTVSPTLTRTTYGVEGHAGEVTLWTARGAGHTWPGARVGLILRLLLGRTTNEIDATAKIWSFAERRAAAF